MVLCWPLASFAARAMHCATGPAAQFSFPETRLGIIPGCAVMRTTHWRAWAELKERPVCTNALQAYY